MIRWRLLSPNSRKMRTTRLATGLVLLSLQACSSHVVTRVGASTLRSVGRPSLHAGRVAAAPHLAGLPVSAVAAAPRFVVRLQASVDVDDVDGAPPLLETTQRSLVKALSWRLTAGIVTLCTSLYFSGSLKAALGIVGADFASKSVTMFVGERLWNKSNVGRSSKGDSWTRSLMKALVWRVFAASNTLISAGLLAGAWDAALKIAGADSVIKTTLFVVFERVWAAIAWGRYQAPGNGEAAPSA
jgi:uncharacterized membrane protein